MDTASQQVNERDLRDLKWCLHTPSLIQDATDARWPDETWFKQWALPSHFDFTPPNNHRLGIRFEALIQSWAQGSDQIDIKAANLPVRDDKRTLGEFDLIVEHEGEIQHWELAVKFYLGVGDTSDMNRFFGPNPIDTLAIKINHLQERQMQLSRQPAAAQLLADNGYPVDRVIGFVKGRLFYPLTEWQAGARPAVFPARVNPAHLNGWWCDLETFTQSMSGKNRYAVLPKTYWLAPVQPEDELGDMDHADLCRLAADHGDGTLAVVELDGEGQELSRGFIVYPRWLKEVSY